MTDFFKFRNNLEEAAKVKQAKKPSEVYENYLEESKALEKAAERLGEYLGNFANNHPMGKFGKLLRNKFPSIKKGSARAMARELEYRADDVDDLLKRIDTGQDDLFGDSVNAREIKRLKAELQAYTKAADKFAKMSEAYVNLYEDELEKDDDDPCWAGYVQVGTKTVNGKEVPNCVPMEEAKKKKQVSEAAYYDYPDYGPVGASEMAQTQLHFIKYAADDITRCLKMGCPMPEWYQNKLAKIEGDMEGLYSYMKGKTRKMKAHQSDRYSMGMSMYGEETLTESKTVEVSPSHARKANDIAKDMFRGEYDTDGSNSFVFKKADTADDFRAELEKQKVELNEDWFYDLVGVKMKDLYFVAKKGYRTNKKVYLQTLHSPTNFGTYWVRDPGDATYFIKKRDAEKAAKEHGGKVVTGITEKAQSGDDEAYEKFFNQALKRFGADSPADLSKEKKKEFFDYVDKNWKSDDEMKNESVQIDEVTKRMEKKYGKGVDLTQDKGKYYIVPKKGDRVGPFKSMRDIENHLKESYISEKLKPSDDVSKWIEDFYDSDAPQFKGKDKEERREMAVAAWLEARREAGYDVDPNPNKD